MSSKQVNGFVINTGLAGLFQSRITKSLDGLIEDSDTADACIRVLAGQLEKIVRDELLSDVAIIVAEDHLSPLGHDCIRDGFSAALDAITE